MENPLPPSLLSGDSLDPAGPESQGFSRGFWALGPGGLRRLAGGDEAGATVLVPTEQLLLLSVSLPPMGSAARRRAAAPFALEDRIAQPLSEVHVALGDAVADDHYLAAVVRHALMQDWMQLLDAHGLSGAALVPDALCLPVPAPSAWSVRIADGRALVRAGDGTGFALGEALLEQAWLAAGCPACTSLGDALPPAMRVAQTEAVRGPHELAPQAPLVDLRQPPYAAPRQAVGALGKRLALVTVLGLVAHMAIAGANTARLEAEADLREAGVSAALVRLQPGMAPPQDFALLAAEARSGASGEPAGLILGLMGKTAGALATQPVLARWQAVNFADDTRSLAIAFDSASEGAIARAAPDLKAVGLTPQLVPGNPVRLVVRQP